MTLAEARAVRVGQLVASPLDDPRWRVRCVRQVHVNGDGTIVRVKWSKLAHEWFPLDSFVKVPSGYRVGQELRPEHRPVSQSNTDTNISTEQAISRVDNGGGATEL